MAPHSWKRFDCLYSWAKGILSSSTGSCLAKIERGDSPKCGATALTIFLSTFKILLLMGLRVEHSVSTLECCPSCRGSVSPKQTALSGGSLGSCIDEEHSQLCELM